ncbi:MAG: alpha-ketoacid dehydrogenase subunit beta [Planctomycetota bacterium]|jgi:pyruvate dehydrogenase E1 component beta subunit
MSNWGTTPTLPEILPAGDRPVTYRQAIFEAMEAALAADERTRLFGEGVTDQAGTYGTTRGLGERFGPERVFDVPTAEQIITALAVGMSLGGLRPIVVHPRNDFLLVAMDQIANHAAKWKAMFGGRSRLPLAIRSVACRGWGSAAQHSQALHATLAHIPGLLVAAPFTPADAKGIALWAALAADEPVVIMEHKWLWNLVGHVPESCRPTPPAGPRTLRRGDDVTIVGISYGVADALIAADELARDRIGADVIDLRWLKPLTVAPIVESVERTGRLVVVDTGHVSFGASAEIVAATLERLSPSALKAAPTRVAVPDVPAPACSERTYYPGPDTVAERVRSIMRAAARPVGPVAARE